MSDPAVLPAPPVPASRPAEAYARASLAPATLRAYQAGWQAFLDWCALNGRQALPASPETVADHLASLATTHSRASLAKRLSVIGQYHQLAAPPAPQRRSLSLEGCRILAGQLRHATEARQQLVAERAAASRACAFCLHRLLPVQARLLRLGPEHPTWPSWCAPA
jgi:hypothetical protein